LQEKEENQNQKFKIKNQIQRPSKMDASFNNFFPQQLWSCGGGGSGGSKRSENASSDKNAMSGQSNSSSSSSSNSILAPSKLAQSQPPHSTNRDLSAISLDNRLYLDGLRHHHHHHHQQQQQQSRHGGSFSNGSSGLSIGGGAGMNSRDNNNNGLNGHSAMSFASQKLRLDIDAIRSNVNRNASGSNNGMLHHQHGTILFNTLNGGLSSGGMSDCFNSSDYGHADSTTPPPTAISMPPPASSASSSSSTISTNLGLNRSSNGSQDGNPEKVKTPNSIRGEMSFTSPKKKL
jgi:hypothetical protein